jgi:hypothetical protein
MKADARRCTQMLDRCRHLARRASVGLLTFGHQAAAHSVVHSTRGITHGEPAPAHPPRQHRGGVAFACIGVHLLSFAEGSSRWCHKHLARPLTALRCGPCCITLVPQRKPRTGFGGCKYFSANESKCTPMHANAGSMPALRAACQPWIADVRSPGGCAFRGSFHPRDYARRTSTRSPAATAQGWVRICVHWRAFAFICGGTCAVVPQTPGQAADGSPVRPLLYHPGTSTEAAHWLRRVQVFLRK